MSSSDREIASAGEKVNGLPLDGIRILESAQYISIPFATRLLADMGAEVIHVESQRYVDGNRTGQGVILNNRPQLGFWNHCGVNSEVNRNKLSFALELDKPQGKEIFLDLVTKSDVVVENWAPRVMNNLGLDYSALSKIKPDIIMVSSSGFGHSGPFADYVSVGWGLEVMCGLTSVTGFPGKPARCRVAYPDYVAGVCAAFAILAALRFRDRTGKGQYIDLSQYEIMAATLPEMIMDYVMNRNVQNGHGNSDTLMVPQGCYPCRGDDNWIVISARTEGQWHSLCQVMKQPNLVEDGRFNDVLSRSSHQSELDQIIGKWTFEWDKFELMHELQKAGIPAGAVMTAKELFLDPHLSSRTFYKAVTHTTPWEGHLVIRPYPGSAFKMSETLGRRGRGAPALGEHNEHILAELLGKSESEISELAKDGIIGKAPLRFEINPPLPLDALVEQGLVREYDTDYLQILSKALGMKLV